MEVTSLVVTHKKVSVEEMAKAWHGDCCEIIKRVLNGGMEECGLLYTCNRVEVYVVGKRCVEFLYEFAKEMGVCERIYDIYEGRECLRHILRVASGLESMIVGEDQILGQVRYFYNVCKKCGGIGEVLDLVFRKAIHVGTKVRRLTRINKGNVSIASAGIELLEREIGLRGKRVLLVGAGNMGTIIAKNIAKKVDLTIANRTYERGKRLAEEVGAKAIRFEEIEDFMGTCDVVIAATSANEPIITKEMIERSGIKVILDIGVPRNVEEAPGVKIYTIDDLRRISDENLRKRLDEVKKAERIIEEELKQLEASLRALRARRAISLMYRMAEEVKREEVMEAYHKLKAKYNLDSSVLDILNSFANSLIKKFLATPTNRLKLLASNDNLSAIKLFEFIFGGDSSVPDGEIEEIKKGEVKEACKGGGFKLR